MIDKSQEQMYKNALAFIEQIRDFVQERPGNEVIISDDWNDSNSLTVAIARADGTGTHYHPGGSKGTTLEKLCFDLSLLEDITKASDATNK